METKTKTDPKRRFAIKLAKLLDWTKDDWHERASECCSFSEETIGGNYYAKTSVKCEWYCKVTWLSEELINVKVCYRLNAHDKTTGMDGYNHTDRTLKAGTHFYSTSKPDVSDGALIDAHVSQMKEYIREAIIAGLRAANPIEVKS